MTEPINRVRVSQRTIPGTTHPFYALEIDAVEMTDTSPVLLFLHGKGECSATPEGLSLLLRNMSPPFQAIQERLRGVTVVSPQAPTDDPDGWNWRDYVEPLGAFLQRQFAPRRVVATGFSRGGRGVLQLVQAYPDLIQRWALVDPQRVEPPDEEKDLLPRGPNAQGWLRFGNAIPKNTAFSVKLGEQLVPEHVAFCDLPHGHLAMDAYAGKRLHATLSLHEAELSGARYAVFRLGAEKVDEKLRQSLYEYLELTFA